MKTLTQYIKESCYIGDKYYNDEVELMHEIVTFNARLLDEEPDKNTQKFFDALWDILKHFEWWNEGTRRFYYYANKNITKEQDETLKKLSKESRQYKYKPKENINSEDMIDGIKKDWGVKDWDKCKKYEDNGNSAYEWDNGIYISSKYGQVCIYHNGE